MVACLPMFTLFLSIKFSVKMNSMYAVSAMASTGSLVEKYNFCCIHLLICCKVGQESELSHFKSAAQANL